MVACGAVATVVILVVTVVVTMRRLVFVLAVTGVFGAHTYGWSGVAVVDIGSQRPGVA
jgi:hypothetical protein